jgi:protein-S-isoprenylcysteine O-methyltransferase Ste14
MRGALIAFLLLPGAVAGVVPWLLRPERDARLDGLVAAIPGVLLLLWCVRDFYVAGRGTLAPWSPPQRLVRVGAYRWSRNPMYLAVTLVLTGWAVGYRSWTLGGYALIVAIAFVLRVIYGEEPWLERTFGDDWAAYAKQVRRWL